MDSEMWEDIGIGLLHTLAYVGIGAVILIFGYFVRDVITPGKLGRLSQLIHDERNINATVIAASNTVAVGFIVAMSIWSTHADFTEGIITTAIFGVVGVVVLAITEIVVDKLTPGDLGHLLIEQKFHPLAAFMASTNLVVGLIVAVSIS